MKIVSFFFRWYFSHKRLPSCIILFIDCLIVIFSGYDGIYLQLGTNAFIDHFGPITHGVFLGLVMNLIGFKIFHTYSGILRYSTTHDLRRVFAAIITGSVGLFCAEMLIRCLDLHDYILMPNVPFGLTCAGISALLMSFLRLSVRAAYDSYRIQDHLPKAYIYGVHTGGLSLAQAITTADPLRYRLAGFVDPTNDLGSQWLMGFHVRKMDEMLVEHMRHDDVNILLVSPFQTVNFRNNTELTDRLVNAGVKILMFPEAEEWDGRSPLGLGTLHEVDIEDLLPRDKIEVDMKAIGEMLKGKRILITGAAGSIGSEMSRQVAQFGPSQLILIDQAETPMHDMRLWMNSFFSTTDKSSSPSPTQVETIVTSICKADRMEKIFAEYRPEYVFHAAAYKHVPMMEDNPAEAVQNNIYGTRVIADLAVKYGTKKFVMISTDKAVNPTNVMGCSKRICEIYCQSLNKAIQDAKSQSSNSNSNPNFPFSILNSQFEKPETQFVTTRFGNVLGSNGSVIPIFREQIKKGGPVRVTHPDIIRYFMLIPEACRLVLEAGTMGKGGEIFVFDMGKPVKILDLARRMIKLSGAKNIEIEFSGLRPGEKLFEEVLNDEEQTMPTPHPKIKVAQVREYPYELAVANENRLMEASHSADDMEIFRIFKEIVPEYKSQNSKYQSLDK